MADAPKDKDKSSEPLNLSNPPKAANEPAKAPQPDPKAQAQPARADSKADADAQAEPDADANADAPKATYRTPTSRYLEDKRKEHFGDEPGAVRLDSGPENDPNTKTELVFVDADGKEVGREEYNPDDEPEQSGLIERGVTKAETKDAAKNRNR